MKKAFFVLAGMALLTSIYSFVPGTTKKDAVTYNVNTEKSRIDWIGAKKTDFHTGIIPVKSGQVQLEDGKLKGGKFVIDLAGLKATDAGGDKLTGHLKSPDFFDVAKFAEAAYEITGVNYTSDNTADISGTLSVKGVSIPFKFQVNIRNADEKGFFGEAFFSLDRTLLGINYGLGMVAKDVQVAVHLFAAK